MNILLAIDDSEAALHACRLVAHCSLERSTLRITLLNVQRPPLRLLPQAGVHEGILDTALYEEGERQLEPARALLRAAGFDAQSFVRLGPPAATLLDAAREYAADVLVMGSGRDGPLGGYAVGSVALRVAPAAPCPVVLVRPGIRLPAVGSDLRVTAAVDGSPESAKAVERLAQCAGTLGVVHVDLVHFQRGLSNAAAMLPPHDDVLRQWSGHESDAALGAPARVLAAAGIPHAEHRATGAPDAGIVAFAAEHGAGLVVMGTRGLGAMHHLLLGSVALKTAHASDVPVVLMR